jgi:glyoxylase I family protein
VDVTPEVLERLVQELGRKFYGHPLEPRNLDRLDFHEVTCWEMKAALEAAVRAGWTAAQAGTESAGPGGILGTHHAAVICSDYERSKRFYTEVLGLNVVAEAYRAERRSHKLDLRLPDGTQVELFSFPDPPKRLSYPEACGLRHLAFRVADIGVAVARLQAHGVAVEPVRVDEYTGKRFTFLADPDGLPLELYEQ